MSRRVVVTAVAMLLALAAGAAAQDAGDIVAKADRARRPGEAFIWKATITSHEGTKAPTVNAYEVYVKGTGKSLVRFVAPARDAGRSLLALDRDLWIYLPEAGKPVRIPMSQRLVGQVANGDIARTNYAGDYTAKLAGTEAVDGVPCHRLDLTATAKDVTYAAIKYWVTRDGLRPVKAEFYAGTGTLLKTGTFDGYRQIDGHTLATRLTLVDAIRKDKKSVIEFSDLRVRDIPEKLFNKNSMKALD
jgi:outer membrane lipoprotein-sorting protein